MRDRRPAQRRQVDAVQCADRDAGSAAANYPFCTIEPNVGDVAVPDPRLDKLAASCKPAKIVPTQLEFVDIAGLVRGASKGEGLGNQFLGHIREVDAIVHVVRCFENDDIDPRRRQGRSDRRHRDDRHRADARRPRQPREARARGAEEGQERRQGGQSTSASLLERVRAHAGRRPSPRGCLSPTTRRARVLARAAAADRQAGACTSPTSTRERLADNPLLDRVRARPRREGAVVGAVCAAIEAEIAQLRRGRPARSSLPNWASTSPGSTASSARDTTCSACRPISPPARRKCAPGPSAGATAPQAAGVIHTDFERGFIRAEVIAYEDFIASRAKRAPRGRQVATGRQGIHRPGRRRHALPVQRLRGPASAVERQPMSPDAAIACDTAGRCSSR